MARKKELIPMVNWVYDFLLWTFSVLVDLFFREVHPRGSWKVPRRGPIIFVAAPHANQVGFLHFPRDTVKEADVSPNEVCRPTDPHAGHPHGSPSPHLLPDR